nr:MAG TPA: hypothetical protein [Bacteriophage sp.]
MLNILHLFHNFSTRYNMNIIISMCKMFWESSKYFLQFIS